MVIAQTSMPAISPEMKPRRLAVGQYSTEGAGKELQGGDEGHYAQVERSCSAPSEQRRSWP